MAAERIGKARCPLCGTTKARLTLSKSGLACMTCDGCNCQLFARSAQSDELLRARHVADAEATPAGTTSEATTKPAPAPTPEPKHTPEPARGWGLFSGAAA